MPDTANPGEASIRTPAWELLALGGLVTFYIAAAEFGGESTLWLRAVAGPAVLAAILIVGSVQMILKEAAALWTSLFWFRLSSAIYLGIGNLAPFVLADEFRLYMETFFAFTDDDVAKVNLLFALSVFVVLLVSNIYLVAIPARNATGRPPASTRAMFAVALLFLAVGAPIKYFLVVPTMFNLLDFVVPSSIALFGGFTIPALFFLTAYGVEQERKYLPFAIILLVFEVAVGLLSMTKQGVLTPLIVFLIAVMRTRVTLPRMAAAGAVILFVFVAIIPVVIDGRLELASRHGEDVRASLGERIEVLYRSIIGDLRTVASEASASGIAMVRISYMNQAGFAVHLYDSGQPGSTFEHAYAAFIPRFLWPDKPIMTAIGSEFNLMARGSDTSASSPTLPGEAYWNLGWAGVPLIMIPMGILLAFISRYSLRVLHDGRWILFPVVIIGMGIGHRVDGHIVADLVGMPVIMLGAHLVLSLLERAIGVIIRSEGAPQAAAGRHTIWQARGRRE